METYPEIDEATLQALGDLGEVHRTLAIHDYFGVGYKVARGAREEIQDVPFCFHLAYGDAGFVHYGQGLQRKPGDWGRDIVVTGIIDGMGGVGIPLRVERAAALVPVLDAGGLLSSSYKGERGDFLTGRAAARFLYRAIQRRATQLKADALEYSLARLINHINLALFEFNQLLFERDYADRPAAGGIGAAMSIAVLCRDGSLYYANCGDCRAGLIRDGEHEPTVEELSCKQTVASIQNLGDKTTVGQTADNKILNPVGLSAKIQPAFRTASMDHSDVLVQLTDGTKEAMMYNSVLRELRWDERTLRETFQHVILPLLRGPTRGFELAHRIFETCVRQHLAATARDNTATVFDNASLMVLRRSTGADAAMDALYQAIENGEARVTRSPYAAGAGELRRIAASGGVIEEHEVARFFELACASGLEIRSETVD